MICGTPYSQGKAFINFAQQFIICLSREDIGKALSSLDMTKKRWKKKELTEQLTKICEISNISNPLKIKKSGKPVLTSTNKDNFELIHKIPVSGKWTDHFLRFSFKRSKGEYFSVELIEIK